MQYLSSNDYTLQEKGLNNFFPAFVICVILIAWLGPRPISYAFGDTFAYARIYALFDIDEYQFSLRSEWAWDALMYFCVKSGFAVETFFSIITFGYVATILIAVYILTPRNVLLGLLFVLASFSFFTFAVNGLRNGLACHIVVLGIALFLADRRFWSFALFFLAFGFHHSVILPIVCFFAAVYVVKQPKMGIFVWLSSIVLSLLFGYYFNALFGALGFDERVGQYLDSTADNVLEDSTSRFRWDFLLYSSMPVLMTWVVTVHRGVTDRWFNILSVTYCLANAFWVLVIRASFSNRFAYLSWFLYPIVIAYPLIMLPVWEDQDNKTGVILVAYAVLTLGISFATNMISFG